METTQIWALIQQWMDAQFFQVTQAQLAKKIGVTRSALSQWKTGQSRPKPEHLLELHRVTRIDYDLLVEALVQDLGYRDVQRVGGERARSAPMSRAAGSAASDDASDSEAEEAGGQSRPSDIESTLAPKKQPRADGPRSRDRPRPRGTGSRRT